MSHLRGDGIAVLLALKTAYKGRLTNIEIMQLQGKLLEGLHFRGRNETIDQFASRTLQMSKNLMEHGVHIAPTSLKNSFISGLGPDFHDIIKDLNRNQLDPEWQPILIKDLSEPARTYLRLQQNLRVHHATYKQSTSTPSSTPNNSSSQPQQRNNNPDNKNRIQRDNDRKHRIVTAIKNGTFKYEDFQKEVDDNKCLYHNSSHPGTKNPSFECTKLQQLISEHPQSTIPKPTKPISQPTQSNTKPKSNPPPQANKAKSSDISNTLPNPNPSESTDQEINDALNNLTTLGDNVNNNEPLIPYLSLTSKSVSIQHPHTTSHNTVVDSGAYPMMFQSSHYFTTLHPWTNSTHTHMSS